MNKIKKQLMIIVSRCILIAGLEVLIAWLLLTTEPNVPSFIGLFGLFIITIYFLVRVWKEMLEYERLISEGRLEGNKEIQDETMG